MSFSNNVQITNLTFLNNTFNMPLIGNKFFLDNLILTSIIFMSNANELSSNVENCLMIFQNGGYSSFSRIFLKNNTINQNFLSISFWDIVNILDFSIIDSLSTNSIAIEFCNSLLLQKFACMNNNQQNPQNFSFVGSCLEISNIPTIFINSSMIVNSTGLLNIPGIVILNTYIDSSILINNSIFVNNSLNSTQNVESYGCSLYILSYPNLAIINSYFKHNLVYLVAFNFGGPVLFFFSPKGTNVLLQKIICDSNLSVKKALILEFQGYNATFQDCSFVMNMQSPYTPRTFDTTMIINGVAAYFGLSNCTIFSNTYRNGLYFLYALRELLIVFDYIIILQNNVYKSAAFVSQSEVTSLEIILSNSHIDANFVSYGGAYTYFSIPQMIVKFNFTTIF